MRYRHLRFPDFRAKAITTSFDDGSVDDIRLVEIMDRYGLKGTFNISSQRFADDPAEERRKVTLEEAREIYLPHGHEIAVHGLRHISPYQSSPSVRIHELLEDRIGLERTFDRLIFGLAFPDDGRNTPEMTRQLADMGFHYCRCLSYDDSFRLPAEFLNLQPTIKYNNPHMLDLLDKFLETDVLNKYISQRESLWFYTWGHSHEMYGQNNFDLIDRLGEKVADRDDVWLATNGEIVEYVRAYRSLLCAADDSILYNPTQTKLWIEIDKDNVTIAPGETIRV